MLSLISYFLGSMLSLSNFVYRSNSFFTITELLASGDMDIGSKERLPSSSAIDCSPIYPLKRELADYVLGEISLPEEKCFYDEDALRDISPMSKNAVDVFSSAPFTNPSFFSR